MRTGATTSNTASSVECPAMPEYVPRRDNWHNPEPLGDAWLLRKADKTARCYLQTHVLGWEPVLMTTDVIRTQVGKASEDILTTHEAWKAAMIEKGWSE